MIWFTDSLERNFWMCGSTGKAIKFEFKLTDVFFFSGSEHDEIPMSPRKPKLPCLLATCGSAMDLKMVS